MSKVAKLITTLFLIIIIGQITGCKSPNPNEGIGKKGLPDTLKVGTLNSPTSYFIFRGDTMGYEYERIRNFARDKNIKVKFVVADNMSSMLAMLDSNKIDIVAYEIPITSEFKDKVLNCGTQNITYQVLVQPKSSKKIKDVTELIGKDIYVEKGSKYESRLRNLDDELGGGIKIHPIDQDTIITEDLIEMVSEGKIPFTIVDSDIAKLNQTYYDNIDISLQISFAQRASWAVNKSNKLLADSIDAWAHLAKSKNEYKEVLKRYFELSKNGYISEDNSIQFKIKKGQISPFDALFKKYAKRINWDWRLLAAQAWSESRFDTTAVSWAGARGLMQLMPSTARAYGLNIRNIRNPELNIKAAVANIKDLNAILASKVPNHKERIKFIIAAYNSGITHVLDAIALAEKYGKNPQKWEGQVSETLMWKSNPEYFNDEVCKAGYFRGSQTIAYVRKVEKYYNHFTKKVKH